MSQQKVDNYKQEKYNRKNTPKKSKAKAILAYIVVAIIGIGILVYLGYSIAVATGAYTPPEPTTAYKSNISAEDLRDKLIQAGDKNVKGDKGSTTETATTTAAEETTTTK